MAARGRTGASSPAILANSKVAVFGLHDGNGYSAGCIANLSPDSVGVSNVFGKPAGSVTAVASALARTFGNVLPLFGYASDDELAAMKDAAFGAIGPLRVWIRDDASP